MSESTVERYRVAAGARIRLDEWDPRDDAAFDVDKKAGKRLARELAGELADLQRVLWAQGRHKLLVVLQAMDTGGKDSTIRHVFGPVNPQGVRVANFKAPTPVELAHDYLWRVHQKTPGDGEIVIFNRSHYEDVLVVRVLGLVPEERWRRRFDQIRSFETSLAEEGTTIVKLFLHISKDEQAERLRSRLGDPTKRWKFKRDDLEHRARWDEYMAAYAEALTRTSQDAAPWYVVPADRKWYRNLVVAQILVDTLRSLEMRYPEPEDLDGIEIV